MHATAPCLLLLRALILLFTGNLLKYSRSHA
ncbi:hypothetical protein M495_12260 [Serratia liquefaciens ATCC 27592]|nr:hypothetical protein M495_12260 [Serratia liquefaciens ATCC 27592]